MEKSLIKNKCGIEKIHEFVKNAFKDGLVAENIDEFVRGLTRETTDGSLCYATDGGKSDSKTAMVFFYEFDCKVPPRYRRNLKCKSPFNLGNMVLDYQSMIIDNASQNDMDELQRLKEFMIAKRMQEEEMYGYRKMVGFCDPLEEDERFWIEYGENYKRVMKKLNDKCMQYEIEG